MRMTICPVRYFKELSDEAANRPLMSDKEYRTEYSIFCLLAAPLIISNDLTRWTAGEREEVHILLAGPHLLPIMNFIAS